MILKEPKSQFVKEIILVEMISRSIKNLLREKFRNSNERSSDQYEKLSNVSKIPKKKYF